MITDIFGFSHSIFILIGFSIICGAVGLLYLNIERRLKIVLHFCMNILGAICLGMGIGFLPAFSFSRWHTYLGLAGSLVLVFSIGIGLLQIKKPTPKKRSCHLILSRLGFCILSVSLIVGLIIFW